MIADAKDFITPHITDAHAIDYPCLKTGFVCELELPRWNPIHIGNFAIDLSPTKHVVMMLIATTICLIVFLVAARSHNRRAAEGKAPRGVANAIEALVLYFRQEVILPNVGPHGERYVPFILTIFFFILFANLLGLVPYGSTATGNISVTATLAILSFIMIEIAGMRTLGKNYYKTIVYWPHDQSIYMKLPLTLILTPIELAGKFTKPVALAIRLFANMTAGHIVVLALLSLIFTFGSWFILPAPFVAALGIMVLEVFIAFLQAFVFALLTSVFIGLIREGAH
ncbi:MAG TPA: F0F1 ATP synthase subunit A [Gemmatimonadaceae bacterium]|nr:F0F1 ATP synthase subunit A [Gemmatimonadaceae bacterium]